MSLYLTLKDEIVKQILNGTYKSGDVLPTEQALCQTYELSRVTVRKALEEMKKEGLVTSVQGQGTVVSFRKGAFTSSLEIIALVAAVHNPFFASFMEHFERVAEENGSLVLFKQDFQGQAFASHELYYRFIKKNIRNVVLWPQTEHIDFELLNRLRSIGMNLVLFDQLFETNVADSVGLDNRHAVTELYGQLRSGFEGEIIYIGYEGLNLPSELQRDQAFQEASGGKGRRFRIPWGGDVERETTALLLRLREEGVLPANLLCCNGPVGLAAARCLESFGWQDIALTVIDFLPEMAKYPMIVYQQPMREMAEKTYQRLIAQNNQGELWLPGRYPVQGEVLHVKGNGPQ
ncbi:GntR family transcriptional regulator [Cohnella nanjingensis]|uniref:GntR family transcriptional regulator n=1 Tax=Cohnella nanjingensis TaxID=1387779 RepID=A0A7X0RR82_9BACL|nr:GntR family transcriptional regulator [Cohnella nanjingensis]MBB6670774.1 GntR family transcriptional regulator [Cohnella nanjingensis]